MEADEQQRRADLSGGVVGLMRAVFEEMAQEFGGMRIAWTGAVWTADSRFGKRAQDGIGCKIVKLEIFFPRALPVVNVRLVPDFPQPGFYFGVAVTFAQMTRKLKNELGPFGVIARRVGPARIDRTDRGVRKIVAIWFGMRRERFGHEADFDDGSDAGGVRRIEDMVEDRPAVNKFAVFILGIDVGRAPLQGGGAVASSKQIVDADVRRHWTERGQFAEKFFSVRRVG